MKPMFKGATLALLLVAASAGLAQAKAKPSRHRHHVSSLAAMNLTPRSGLSRPYGARDFHDDRLPTSADYRLSQGVVGSVGYHTSPGAHAIDPGDVNQAAAQRFDSSDKTVGAAVDVKF